MLRTCVQRVGCSRYCYARSLGANWAAGPHHVGIHGRQSHGCSVGWCQCLVALEAAAVGRVAVRRCWAAGRAVPQRLVCWRPQETGTTAGGSKTAARWEFKPRLLGKLTEAMWRGQPIGAACSASD